MTKRGKVLRDTNAGPGLLIVDGKQVQFTLEGLWRSEVPPKPGMVVDVELAADGSITGIAAVADGQLAKEQAEVALAAAKEKGAAFASTMVAKFGMPSLVAAGALIVGWFFLSAVSVKTPLGSLDFTFWQVLGFLNSSNALENVFQSGRASASTGFYGFLAVAALAGPFIHHFWKDKRAALGGLLPLLFMLLVGFMVNSALSSVGADADAGLFKEMAARMREEMMKAISVGFGVYLSLIASLYFAGISAKKFLAGQA
jgi:hypothetical protein